MSMRYPFIRLGPRLTAWWQDTRGDFDDMLYAMLGILVMIMLFLFIATIITVFAVRQHVYTSIVNAAQYALATNALDPALATSGKAADAEATYINPTTTTDAFNAAFAQMLGWPSSAYTAATVTVYEPNEKGQSLPAGLVGTVPGAGLYVNFPYTINVLPFMRSHTLTFGFAVQAFIPANRYDGVSGNWTGG